MVCGRYSRAYLRHLMAAQEPLAGVLNTLHNLAYYLDTMRSVRNAIATDTLPALLARVRAQADRWCGPSSAIPSSRQTGADRL